MITIQYKKETPLTDTHTVKRGIADVQEFSQQQDLCGVGEIGHDRGWKQEAHVGSEHHTVCHARGTDVSSG
jgi:predicted metal-dependent TIM-barrel fold hydrolase